MDFGPARTTVEISPFNEWRVETAKSSILSLKLESGVAEIFGTELSPNITYQFKESTKIAISTYHGCKLSYTTTVPLDSDYISEETTLKQVLNLHLAIENLSSTTNQQSRILIIGPKDCGKTTLARTLTAYSLKTSDKQPIIVNLNPKLPHFAISSQLTATKVYDLLDVETVTFGESLTTGPGTGIYRSQIPLVKNFGLENFNENLELYKCLISELSVDVNSKILDSTSDSGTVIIDTPPLNVSDWKTIQHIVDSFKVNVLLVVGNERLLVDLRKKLTFGKDNNEVSVVKMPRSSGCIEKEAKYERELQQRSIKQYFYGVERSQLNPYTFHSSIKSFIFLRPMESDSINNEFLDFMNGDAEDDESSNYPTKDDDSDYDPLSGSSKKVKIKRHWKYKKFFTRLDEPKESDLMNVIAAIIDDKDLDLNKILSAKSSLNESEKLIELNKHVTMKSVLGFCYISGCDDSTGKLKLLIPSPVTNLPGKILVITQMRYQE